ncbi:MAG: carboxynorspermidine decarboxylase [Deferribacterales bacterium]|nr:carboxynorspermidine decarboxylase [Deferribacterales bacterium]
MAETYFPTKITGRVKTPCYLISEKKIEENCQVLDYVQKETGAKILLALKAFAQPYGFNIIKKYLHGVCASGPVEARLGREEFSKEVHTFAPAFTKKQFDEVLQYSDHIIFNSVNQFNKYAHLAKSNGKEVGLRVNPGYSEVEVELYDPCAVGSRFGVNPENLTDFDIAQLDGLHFHAMCEQNADVLVRVLESFENRFGKYIDKLKWVNFGGGHHITREDYDINLLIETINKFRKKHNNINVYLEPGEAVVLNAGVFVTEVLDIIYNGIDIAILDCSAETHMPDVLAMPYTPKIIGADKPGVYKYTYRLGGISCLAGDFIGTYSFKNPLKVGDRLVLLDMALYSFVKNTTFNGIELPSIIYFDKDYTITYQKDFDYFDYKNRLS